MNAEGGSPLSRLSSKRERSVLRIIIGFYYIVDQFVYFLVIEKEL